MKTTNTKVGAKYKAVIFDFDDTLVESRVSKWAHHKHVAKNFYNIELSDEDIRKHWGRPFDVLVAELYQNSDTLENMHKAIISVKKDFPKYPYKEAISTVQKLLDQNIKTGVVSATTTMFLIEDLTHLGFPVDSFSIIQGADKTKVHKPEAGVFLPLIEQMEKEGINKEDIVYIGDSLDDFKASTGAGLNFIALTTGLYSYEDFKNEGAETVMNSIEEILSEIL